MTPTQAILLALIQGVTEFLPISSSAHLILLPYVLGWGELLLALWLLASGHYTLMITTFGVLSCLGVTLLVRGRKGVQLTEIGRLVESEAQGIVARYDQMRETVSSQQRLEGGTVRIGGGATAVSFILPEAIAGFQAAHPKVRFQMREAGSSEIADDVVSGQLELGVVTLPVRDRELQVTPLATDRIVLVARHDHPLAKQRQVRIQDLADQAFVAFEAGSALRQIIDAKLRDAGVEVNVVMELRSIPAILRMVSTTGNLAFVSQLGMPHQDEAISIDVRGLRIERRLAVISRRGTTLSPAAGAFTQRLLQLHI